MRHQFHISDVGLKLIKSYEGYRPDARQLDTGRRVAGYGHAVAKGESLSVSREEAESLLRDDLAPYEALVNDHIFAPLTQGQFDALVSLAFNIGTDAFLASDVVAATNNGRILDAANGFDIWRNSEINGQIYTIDALVRRRTAEKILFLRPEKALALAPRLDLPPRADEDLIGASTYGPLGDHGNTDSGVVAGAADVTVYRDFTPSRRREDGPAGVLTLSEVYDEDFDATDFDNGDFDNGDFDDSDYERDIEPLITPHSDKPSPIAEAAAEVSDRLDALIARPRRNAGQDLPKQLIDAPEITEQPSKVVPFTGRKGAIRPVSAQNDSPLSRLDYMKAQDSAKSDGLGSETEAQSTTSQSLDANPGYNDATIDNAEAKDSAERFIKAGGKTGTLKRRRNPNTGPFIVMCLLGMTLIGASLGAMFSGFDSQWGLRGEMATNLGLLIGGLFLLGSVYYVLKIIFRRPHHRRAANI
ncbi:lysozyme [Fretibacter rubidus]|uniref:lysozyme n=1 Tax=Fretibacter rubidus TaxID=570162 RepID=UPI00352AFA09